MGAVCKKMLTFLKLKLHTVRIAISSRNIKATLGWGATWYNVPIDLKLDLRVNY